MCEWCPDWTRLVKENVALRARVAELERELAEACQVIAGGVPLAVREAAQHELDQVLSLGLLGE